MARESVSTEAQTRFQERREPSQVRWLKPRPERWSSNGGAGRVRKAAGQRPRACGHMMARGRGRRRIQNPVLTTKDRAQLGADWCSRGTAIGALHWETRSWLALFEALSCARSLPSCDLQGTDHHRTSCSLASRSSRAWWELCSHVERLSVLFAPRGRFGIRFIFPSFVWGVTFA